MPRRPVPAVRSVLVTGASTGIGRTTALHLARTGWTVFAGVRRDADAKDLESAKEGDLTPVKLDVTDEESIASAAEFVESATDGKGLGGLVNNAGIVVPGPLEFVPLDELRRQLEVNTIGPIAVSQTFIGIMRGVSGRIVNVGSISGKIATPMMGPYSASKFALEALSDAMRNELTKWGMHVALVDPGNIATPIWQKTTSFADDLLDSLPPDAEQLYEELISSTRKMAAQSERKAISPEAVARAIAHALSSPKPRTRYFVGNDAKLGAIAARFVPDSVRDRIVNRVIGV